VTAGKVSEGLISVIVPMYNAERHIAMTLASALTQTHRDIEVIVIDDGSSDESAAIVETIAAEDGRIRLIHQPNRGVAHARNLGISQARGQFIAPLDADDLWHPEKLERQLAAMLNFPRVGCVCTWCWHFDEENRPIIVSQAGVHWTGYVVPALVLENFSGCASAPLMRRSCVEQAGGYDASLRDRNAQGCEDYKLLLDIAQNHDLLVLPMRLTGYRMTADGMSHNYWRMLRSYDLVMSEFAAKPHNIPAKIFRWSRGNICSWLGDRARRSGAYGDAACLYLLAVRSDVAYAAEFGRRAVIKLMKALKCLPLARSVGLVRTAVNPDYPALSSSVTRPLRTARLIERRRRYVGSLLALNGHLPSVCESEKQIVIENRSA
jgi:glycosyltransferase involved in cell wall biosynthesis